MSKSPIKTDLYEVLHGVRSFPELLEFFRNDMSRIAEDTRSFVRQSVTGPASHRIAFIRVPKCATTSIHTELTRAYRSIWALEGHGLRHVHPGACDDAAEEADYSTWDQRRAVLSYYLAHPKTKYTWGHVAIDSSILERFGDEFEFITTLRHPVDRWLSHYNYNKHRRREDPRYDIDSEIEEFLETERGQGIAEMSTAYYSGTAHDDDLDRTADEIQQRARENLQKFDLVGFVRALGDFEEEFAEVFDFEIDIGHHNRSPAPSDEKKVADDVREKIRDACEADMRLYDWARDHFRG